MSIKKVGKWKIETEEVILFLIIILNILDAIEQLPSNTDYIKKIISWAALGYLFYKAKPTKIIFGTRQKNMDFMLIVGYFLILIKDLVSYAMSSLTERSKFLTPLFEALTQNQSSIEIFGIYAGLFLILVVAINMVMRHPVKGPSVMHIIHEDGPIPQNIKTFFHRISTSFIVLVAFYLIVFNLTMEWLAIAIDAPMLMIALVTYIFFVIKHKEKFSSTSFLARFGDFGSSFYEGIIKKFTYKKTILRALFAMLVLHIGTEALHFIWPYIFGVSDSLYFYLLSNTHYSAIYMFSLDSIYLSLMNKFLLMIATAGNIIAILFLLIAPGYLWYLIYKNKKFSLNKINIAVLVSSLVIFILAPAFRIRPLINQKLTGVDIAAQSIIQNSFFDIQIVILLALSIGLICSLISSNIKIEKRIMRLITVITQFSFTIYIFLFAFSISAYYIRTIMFLGSYGKYFLMFIMILFFLISILFYTLGTISFIKDTLSHANEHLKVK